VEQGLEVGCPAGSRLGRSLPDTVDGSRARMNQDLETGPGEAKTDSVEELGEHAWCMAFEWSVPMLQTHPQGADEGSRNRESSDSRRQDSRPVEPGALRRSGEVGRYPAPTRAAPLGGSNVPRVHAWTGREPTLRSGAVGVGVTSARRSGCRWRLFGAEAGEQRGCGESRPRRSARIGAAGTLRNRIAVVATTEACRRLTPSARGAVDGSGGTSKRAAHAAGREGLRTETAQRVRVTR